MDIKSDYYKTTVRPYYEGFTRYLLADFVYGNKRIEYAIKHALKFIPLDANRVLDIGCGIGWSTWTINWHLKNCNLVGIDLSARAIEIAKRLFQEESLQFFCMDILEDNITCDSSVDAIVLLDVYEHFRRGDRSRVHQFLDCQLTDCGIVFLSYPSISSFVHDYSKRPEHLQPVDEFVTEEDMEKLAEEIHGNVVFRKDVGIFQPSDYTYTVITRSKRCITQIPALNYETCFESLDVRHQRVLSKLNIRVTPSGTMLPLGDDSAICFLLSNFITEEQILSRTFVEAFPKPVRIIVGPYTQPICDGGKSLVPEYGFLKRLRHAFQRRTEKNFIDIAMKEAVEGFFQENQIKHVVADSLDGVSLFLPMCQELEIPLSVWYSGTDEAIPDMSHLVLEPNLSKYIKVFVSGTERVAQHLHSLGVPIDKIHQVPYGIDNRQFCVSRAAETAPVFVSIHDFFRTEEPEFVLLAFRDVLNAHPDARLVMVGNTYLSRRCARLVSWMKIDHAVDFCGPLTHIDWATTLKQGRAYICLNQNSFLGARDLLTYGVIASMFIGLPGIVSPTQCMRDLIGENCCVFIDTDNTDVLSHQMIRFINNPAMTVEMGEAARQLAYKNYCLGENVEKFINALQL